MTALRKVWSENWERRGVALSGADLAHRLLVEGFREPDLEVKENFHFWGFAGLAANH